MRDFTTKKCCVHPDDNNLMLYKDGGQIKGINSYTEIWCLWARLCWCGFKCKSIQNCSSSDETWRWSLPGLRSTGLTGWFNKYKNQVNYTTGVPSNNFHHHHQTLNEGRSFGRMLSSQIKLFISTFKNNKHWPERCTAERLNSMSSKTVSVKTQAGLVDTSGQLTFMIYWECALLKDQEGKATLIHSVT